MYVPEIRFCGPDDLPALLELNAASPWPWPDAVIVGDIQDDTSQVTYIGAFSTAKVPRLLGYAALGRESRKNGLLLGLVVHGDYQRRSIGTQLLAAAEDCASYLGFSRLKLRVRRSNAGAMALYEKMSFVREGVSRAYYSDGEDAILMSVKLR